MVVLSLQDWRQHEARRRQAAQTTLQQVQLACQSWTTLLSQSLVDCQQSLQLAQRLEQLNACLQVPGLDRDEKKQDSFHEADDIDTTRSSPCDAIKLVQVDLQQALDSFQEADNLCQVLSQAHDTMQDAWDDYFCLAENSSSNAAAIQTGKTKSPPSSPTKRRTRTSSSKIGEIKNTHKQDPWLAEMQYRQTVQQQGVLWKDTMKVLQEILERARAAEAARRRLVPATLGQLLHKQQAAFQTSRNVDASVCEQVAVDDDKPVLMSLADSETAFSFFEGLFTADSFLESEHLMHAAVVQVVHDNCGGSSDDSGVKDQSALMVITHDFWLWIFALHDESVDIGATSPEQALILLVGATNRPLVPSAQVDLNDDAVEVRMVQDTLVEIQSGEADRLLLRVASPHEQIALIAATRGHLTRLEV